MFNMVRQKFAVSCVGIGLMAASAFSSVFAQTATPVASPTDTGGAVAGCATGSANQTLSDRFVSTYKDYLNWNGDPPGDGSQRKGYPDMPESAPPMPFTNWPQGGTEIVGYENMYNGALMDAIWCGPDGQHWKDSRFTIYGWIEPGGNVSTSHSNFNFHNGTGGNFPASDVYQPDTIQVDQLALYFEKTPDVVQKEHFDWGFRVTPLWGTDAKYTYARGLFSSQFTNNNGTVQRYGVDIPMAYIEGYWPGIFDGLLVRVGRYISVPDIGAQLSPNNYTYSHSLLYTYDPYTKTGIEFTWQLDKNWSIQTELSVGNDVAPWFKKTVSSTYQYNNPTTGITQTLPNPNSGENLGAQATPGLCVHWASDDGKAAIYPCLNGAAPLLGNAGNYGWNNLQQEVFTAYYKFNDQWHTSIEAWKMFEYNTPNMTNSYGQALYTNEIGGGPTSTGNAFGGPSGAMGGPGCGPTNGPTCSSHEWAAVNYILYQPNPRDVFVLRNEIFDDKNGQRTGFPTKYHESTISWNHWIGKAITLRPEIRYEWAGVTPYGGPYNNPCPTGPFDMGVPRGCTGPTNGSTHQLMLAMDAIIHF
jgi:hypothetical protein